MTKSSAPGPVATFRPSELPKTAGLRAALAAKSITGTTVPAAGTESLALLMAMFSWPDRVRASIPTRAAPPLAGQGEIAFGGCRLALGHHRFDEQQPQGADGQGDTNGSVGLGFRWGSYRSIGLRHPVRSANAGKSFDIAGADGQHLDLGGGGAAHRLDEDFPALEGHIGCNVYESVHLDGDAAQHLELKVVVEPLQPADNAVGGQVVPVDRLPSLAAMLKSTSRLLTSKTRVSGSPTTPMLSTWAARPVQERKPLTGSSFERMARSSPAPLTEKPSAESVFKTGDDLVRIPREGAVDPHKEVDVAQADGQQGGVV